jgi:cytosine/adenosine deaminase-related metal-dependent hydrolase
VWCPTSNGFLYGSTAPRALFDSGLDVLLGTDALVSGEGSLFDELRAARARAFLADSRLEEAVGATARRRLSLPPPSIEPGAKADVIALAAPVLEAAPRDLDLVLVGGKPVFADERHARVFDVAGVPAEALTVGGVPKRVIAPLASIADAAFRLAPELRRIIA